jgi:hypothetical protein
MLGRLGMETSVLIERDGMGRMITAVYLPTATAVVTAFEEGEGLLAGRVVTLEGRSVGLNEHRLLAIGTGKAVKINKQRIKVRVSARRTCGW